MNTHPILVHLPIAFLTIYALAEIFTIRRLKFSNTWFYIKSFLLLIGFLGTRLALMSGESAINAVDDLQNKIEFIKVHEHYAEFTASFFVFILVIYIVLFIEKRIALKNQIFGFLERRLSFLKKIFSFVYKALLFIGTNSVLMTLLSIGGLILVSITGALGGIIVYGVDVDPFASFVARALGLI
ncbi:MAG: hypothetical protein H6791_02130 [Candidatus Nomurabacteria bacterium]|nr:MAG: hypothetical protein H6791_02130 [Candidatus Nomurabacteria bacterium]